MEIKKKNLAVFISGQGSNLEILLQNKNKFEGFLVVSSSPKAFGLQRAQNHQAENLTLNNPINWDDLQEILQERSIDLIFLAGFMKIVPSEFVSQWRGRIFNLHPSMLPKFKGLRAIERAFESGEDVGVTIHHVVPEVDAGEIVLQEIAVPAAQFSQLTLSEVVERTHQKEHELVQKWVKLKA